MSILPQKSALAQAAGEGCPTGTKLAGASTNVVRNGNFNVQPSGPFATVLGNALFQGLPANTPLPTGDPAVTWSSNLPYVATNSLNPPNYPPDSGVSIQTGAVSYAGGIVRQAPFPGDPANGVPASNTWLYSNGNSTGAPYTIWQQQINAILPNTTYIFYTYVSNAIAPTASAPDDPIIRFLVNGTPVGASFQVLDDSDPLSGHNGADLWDRKSIRYTTGANQTSLTLTVRDEQLGTNGDDFGFVAIGGEPCRPNIGIAKSVGTPVANANGSFTVPYTVTVRNYAPAETQYNITQLQVNDDLATTFAGATINSVTGIQSGTLAANTAFNGGSNKNLLQGTDTLAGQQSATITFNVNVTPGASLGPFNNTATVTGNHAASTVAGPITDTSVNGIDPDTGGDGTPVNGDTDPSNNTSPTPISFGSASRLGVAKAAGVPTINDDGSFTVAYTIAVRNAGNSNLTNLQLTENLSQTFTGATNFSLVPNSLSGTGVTVNSNFNGTSNTNLLAGTDSLAVGANATITFSVRVNPGTKIGPYNNITVGNATGPNNTPVTDQSTNGTNVDPDGDGDPTNNSVPTPVTFTSIPRLGVAKAAGTVTANNDGSFTIPYTVAVRNVGNIRLNNLQVIENLSQTFNGVTAFSVEANSLSGTGVTVNPNFNGTSNTNLLAGTDSLAVGANATITFNVRVTPGSQIGPYNNTAVGNATAANGAAVSDQSTDGTNVDPDGDGDPTNNSVVTAVKFASNLRLLKRITGVTRNGAPFNSVSFTGVDADADANALTQAGLRPIGVRAIGPTNNLTSNDEVEYTIYFLSDGGQAANKVNFCDLIPTGTTYIPNSTVVQVGNTQLTSSDRFLPSLTPLPPGNSCLNQNNANGAVIVDLGNIPNTNGNNFGFIRLRVKIN
ncbi:MAG: hypothetical protein ACHBN1_12225 [Heteroscytonema crispum UTEX LB 1556]